MSMLNESDWQSPFGPSDAEQAEYDQQERDECRAYTLAAVIEEIGPRPRVATVLRMIRLRRRTRYMYAFGSRYAPNPFRKLVTA